MRGLLLCLVLIAGCSHARGDESAHAGFAVLELFTSEGCSSCPPADALLAQLTREAASSGQAVYTLSFHVDYWNDLGWQDPFSLPDASSRQRTYAAALSDRRVYTPELVVNGHEAFVGSDRARARGSIRDALAQKPGTALKVDAHASGDRVQVQFGISGVRPPHAVLQLALVQADATSRVTRGENLGSELHHVNVVRVFRSLGPEQLASGSASLPLPAALGRGAKLIAYLQDLPSMQILAAGGTAL
ncbi:MAG TPA: DUF1223 domain-containing protein [Polyangiales bacterium]|nr:DUF1223 domain-containing protein [Polyangiales bacterium]